METKKCSKCTEIKPIDKFYKIKNGTKIRSFCKKCDNIMSQSYKNRNKNMISSYNKKYKSKHKKQISDYNKNYNIINREKIQKRQTEQHKVRRKNDPNYKMSITLRNRIYKLLNGSNNKTTKELIGCDYNFFLKWLEFQFDDVMTFDNHGEIWHVDHVSQCNTFDLLDEEQQKLCFHWSNMRPLEKSINLGRPDERDYDDIKKHNKIVRAFLKQIKKNKEKYNFTLL
ncbi:putative prophage protein [Acanthamoeba castellanii mimivirus]|uniref:Uncharacterized protein L246 n=5 Tax=Mimivirus TaxID=315393 RepID=YL246_MIMIV|nr:putative prophage protein [Acanthamoeba polyphaga mimivirus]Q5UPT5.1 RecName: Full=Uncharacterized protein L246 [Acanthamoeba polyphaga mimivirus]AHJ39989.2 hypothetical protein [Samba virus]AMZ02693.1 putative prophage protein [Mimivirus Bombay]QTF49152.1 putative prophage protein [Mimivirus reunion]WMV61595.1 putative prophage protein [Mimivirus sp.]BAV61338.1 putative prophage protein [Acanthamoeba castellanii mimivirus]